MRPILPILGLAFALATFVPMERAEACGGCFNPPETTTVVTDHRMIFTIAQDRSTLYDQIRYTGNPASFAWVLPYKGDVLAGDVVVGVSSDIVFTALDGITQTTIRPPPTNCPALNCAQSDGVSGSGSSSGGLGAPPGVTVLKHEVVGPYDTAYLKATDANALQTWLSTNGYALPPDVAAVVTAYQNDGFNFLAVKLEPGKDVQDMRPIRVTTKGANVQLPLRMVAAGTGPTVGITLWVLAEGRYEPQNFPTFTVKEDELVWDFAQNKSNYVDIRAAKTTAGAGKAWEIESSSIVYPQTVTASIQQGSQPPSGVPYPTTDAERAAIDYLPKTSGSTVVQTAVQVRDEDITTLFYGIPTATSRVTRLRADLAHSALATDLSLVAASDQTLVPTFRQVTKSTNVPACPTSCGGSSGDPTGTGTGTAGGATSASTFSCAATGTNGTHAWLLLVGGLGTMTLASAMRRRKKDKHSK